MSSIKLLDLFGHIHIAQGLLSRPAEGRDGQPATLVRTHSVLRDLTKITETISAGVESFLPVSAPRSAVHQLKGAVYFLTQGAPDPHVHVAPKDVVEGLGALKVLETMLAEAYPLVAAEHAARCLVASQTYALEKAKAWPAFELKDAAAGLAFSSIRHEGPGQPIVVVRSGPPSIPRDTDNLDILEKYQLLQILAAKLPVTAKMPDLRPAYSLRADTELTRENMLQVFDEFIKAQSIGPTKVRIYAPAALKFWGGENSPEGLASAADRVKGFFASAARSITVQFHAKVGDNVLELS